MVESAADAPVGALVFAFHPHQDVFVIDADRLIALPDLDPRVATILPFVETALQVTLDAGPVLARVEVPVLPGDDAETLAARVLAEEHRLLVATVRSLGA